jgi:hypothetical protein
MIDISTPSSPSFAGCYGARGYTHDVQCVLYDGPDSGYTGREICFASNEDKMDIIDVTNKGNPSLVSSFTYSGYGYTHQGWLTEDKHYFLIDDEVDELSGGGATKTVICDVSNLENPIFTGAHFGETNAIDHNQYVLGKYTFQANYRSGLRILELDDIANGNLVEIAYFDTYPGSNSNAFDGAWSNYPYFQSGVVIISDINRGLFVVRPTSLQFAPTTSPAPTPAPSPAPPTASPTECAGGDTVNIGILTDNYPTETSYTLQETCDGSSVFERPEGYFIDKFTLYEDTICTSNSLEYLFTISDSFGDGICCSEGIGEYTVTLNGSEVASGGEFDSSDTATFGSCEQTPACEESTLGVPFGGSEYFCEDFPSNVCNRDEAKSHCPVTCDACAEYACEDSMLDWVFRGNNASCAALAGAPPNFIEEACQIEEIAQTCRSTCGSCD